MWRTAIALSVAASALVACADQSPRPSIGPAIQGVLDEWRQGGVSCDEPIVGMPDDLPQWECAGHLRGVDVTFEMTADGATIRDILAEVPAATDRAAAMTAFGELVRITAPLDAVRSSAISWLNAWDGIGAAVGFGTTTLRLQADATWITLALIPNARDFPNQVLEPAESVGTAAGACGNPDVGQLATFTLGVDTPIPRCGLVFPEQRLRVVNNTATRVTVTFHQEEYVLEAGGEEVFADPFGTIWQPGLHVLHTSLYGGDGGPEIVLVSR